MYGERNRRLLQPSAVAIGEGIMKVEDLVQRDKSFEEALRSMEENMVKGRKRKYRVSVAHPSFPERKVIRSTLETGPTEPYFQ